MLRAGPSALVPQEEILQEGASSLAGSAGWIPPPELPCCPPAQVQRTMDEEELAFQKSLAKNYTEEMAELDDSERERLQLLENYMETMGASLGADEDKDGDGADLENVEAFLDQLSKAAHGADGDGTDGDGGDLEAGEMSPADQHSPRSSALKPVEWKEGR